MHTLAEIPSSADEAVTRNRRGRKHSGRGRDYSRQREEYPAGFPRESLPDENLNSYANAARVAVVLHGCFIRFELRKALVGDGGSEMAVHIYFAMFVAATGLMSVLPAMAQEGSAASVEPAVAPFRSVDLTLRPVYVIDSSGLTAPGKRTLDPLEAMSVAWHMARGAATTARDTAAAQMSQSKDGCFFHSRPAPACRFFGVTDFGVAFGRNSVTVPPGPDVVVIPGDQTALGSRVIGDLGVMRNIGPRDAIGVSWFVTTDFIGGTGPAVRYRRWLTDRRSLDFAVGVPVAVSNPYPDTTVGPEGLVLGLVKYNPVPWMGVAVRPEVVRHRIAYDCSTHPCVGITERIPRVLIGIEFSGKPGAIISGVIWGLMGLLSGQG